MSFEKSLSIADDMQIEINQETRAVSFNVLRLLVKATPVDTGRAKGNWFVSPSERPNRSISEFRKARQAIADGSETINSVINKRYPTIVITSNLPYIERLNDGHSKQAPAKFVELAIQRVQN